MSARFLSIYYLFAVVVGLSCVAPKARPYQPYGSFSLTKIPEVKVDDLSVVGVGSALVLQMATPLPFYPLGLLSAGIRGQVDLLLSVDAKGNVHSAKVVHSSQPEFEEPALRAAESWKFFRRDFPGTSSSSEIEMTCRMVFSTSDP